MPEDFKSKKSGFDTCKIETPSIGSIEIRDFIADADAPHIYKWVTMEYATFWGMQNKTPDEVKNEYKRISNLEYARVFIGLIGDEQKFLMEQYQPSKEPVGKYFDVQQGDLGIHLLVAPAIVPVHNFTYEIFSAVMEFCFFNKNVQRIIIEPDVRNEKMIVLSKRIGFEFTSKIKLPHKEASLGFCTRDQFMYFKNKK